MGRLTAPPSRLGSARGGSAPAIGRGGSAERGYGGPWPRLSRLFRRRNPLCRGCAALERVAPAELTDHVVPHTAGTRQFWDQGLWQASCKWHHDAVKQQLERLYDAGELAVDDLWLDSPVAVALARQLMAEGGRV